MMTPEQHEKFPTGLKFLKLNSLTEDASSQDSDQYIADKDEKLVECLPLLGDILSVAYRLAACAWICRKNDHVIEHLTGRVVNHSLGAIRLIRAGFYDESLVLTRGIGEIANLLTLFCMDHTEFNTWATASRGVRLKEFSPAKVRDKLLPLSPSGQLLIDYDRYRELCELAAHPVPQTIPGNFNTDNRAILGVSLQPVGLHLAINELCLAVSAAALPIAFFLENDQPRLEAIIGKASTLLGTIDDTDISNYRSAIHDIGLSAQESFSILKPKKPQSQTPHQAPDLPSS